MIFTDNYGQLNKKVTLFIAFNKSNLISFCEFIDYVFYSNIELLTLKHFRNGLDVVMLAIVILRMKMIKIDEINFLSSLRMTV